MSFGSCIISHSPMVYIDNVFSERKIGDDNRYGGPAGEYVLTINYNFDIQNFPSRREIRDKVPCSGLFFANRCAARGSPPHYDTAIYVALFLPRAEPSRSRTNIHFNPSQELLSRNCERNTSAKGDASQKEESLIAIKLTCVCLIHYASCLTDLTAGRYRS